MRAEVILTSSLEAAATATTANRHSNILLPSSKQQILMDQGLMLPLIKLETILDRCQEIISVPWCEFNHQNCSAG